MHLFNYLFIYLMHLFIYYKKMLRPPKTGDFHCSEANPEVRIDVDVEARGDVA